MIKANIDRLLAAFSTTTMSDDDDVDGRAPTRAEVKAANGGFIEHRGSTSSATFRAMLYVEGPPKGLHVARLNLDVMS